MIEVTGDLWIFPADLRVITTNGFVKKNGEAVMGRGCAKEAALKWPDLPLKLGYSITQSGNHVFYLIEELCSFPVKHNWWEKADKELIERSARELLDFIDYRAAFDQPFKSILLPRPGCGNGQLDWKDVKPIIEPILDDRFYVITYE